MVALAQNEMKAKGAMPVDVRLSEGLGRNPAKVLKIAS
jgi:hypothetical protein